MVNLLFHIKIIKHFKKIPQSGVYLKPSVMLTKLTPTYATPNPPYSNLTSSCLNGYSITDMSGSRKCLVVKGKCLVVVSVW